MCGEFKRRRNGNGRRIFYLAMFENTERILHGMSNDNGKAAIIKLQNLWKKEMNDDEDWWLPLDMWTLCGADVLKPLCRMRAVVASVPCIFKEVLDRGSGDSVNGWIPFHPNLPMGTCQTVHDILEKDLTILNVKDVGGKKTKQYLRKWRRAFEKEANLSRRTPNWETTSNDCERNPDGTYDIHLVKDKLMAIYIYIYIYINMYMPTVVPP
jgi:hypothetical protein